MIFICRKHIWSGGSSAMCTYGEGKINESYETQLMTGFCLRLSPSGSMGLIGLRRRGWPPLPVFPVSPLSTVVVSLWSVAFSAVVTWTWISLPALIWKLCPLTALCAGRVGYFLLYCSQGGHVRGAEADAFVCFISWELGFFSEATGRKSECFHARKAVIGRNWQVGSGNRSDSPPSLVESESKDRVTDSSTLGAHFHRVLIHTAVEQIHLSATVHEFKIIEEWLRKGWWGKGSPAGSMQRGNWSSFGGKPVIVVACRWLILEIRPLLKTSQCRVCDRSSLFFTMSNDSSCSRVSGMIFATIFHTE